MLFVDFVCFFFCIVLLNAHPISKSNLHDIIGLENTLDNGYIINSHSFDNITNPQYSTWKKDIFEEQDLKRDETNKLDFTKLPKKHIKFKRITTKIMDLRGFERLENFDNQKYLHNSIKTYKVKEKENHAANELKLNTDSHVGLGSSFLENKHFFYNDISMEPTRDDTECAGTAEIEAILNEIKEREIQIIADQIPSVSNLISNTVTETTFASMPLISETSIYPGLVFNTFLLVDNKTLINNNRQGRRLRNSKLHNIALRSLANETSTLAYDVENMLQNKIKKVYHKIKNKISKDFNKEIKKTRATVKKQVDKINKKICLPSRGGSKHCSLLKATTKPIPKKKTKTTLHEARNSRNTLFNQRNYKHKLTTLTTHTIPTVGDDLSMLSIVEQLLEKSEEDNAINMLTTKNNYSAEKDKEKLFKRNSLNETLKQSNHKLLNIKEDVLSTEYTLSDTSNNNESKNNNLQTDATTEDTSYEGLSNKLSYNDYVNGYKYYLNFQRDKGDLRYSNQVRYQAHKHHSVDDIGKFILNKIPQLPTTRLRRDYVDSETFYVQNISTKNEDSWFKKHFFMFMDSNTPKKFHTSQTISLKPSEIRTKTIFFADEGTTRKYKNKRFPNLFSCRSKKNVHEVKTISTQDSLDEQRYNVERETKHSRMQRQPSKRSNLDNHYKQKSDNLSSINNYKKNGFVDIDLINKPTAIIKLNNKNKKTNKIRNIFHKIRFGHNKHNKKEKRQIQNRFNIFKGIRNIFKEKNEGEKELKGTRRHKIFDYEVMTTNMNAVESYELPKFKKLLKIDEIRQQIPNISADFGAPHKFFSGSYINLTGLASVNPGRNEKFINNKKPELDDDRRSFSILTGSQYLTSNQQPETAPYFVTNNQKDLRTDDIINVNIKTNTDDVDIFEKSNTFYPLLIGMTKNNIRSELDDMKMRLLSSDVNKEKQKSFYNLRKGYKNQYLHSSNTRPTSNLLKEYYIDKVLINDATQYNRVNLEKPASISGTANRIMSSKKSPRNNKLIFLYNSTYSLAPISSLRPLKYKKVTKSKYKIDTKSNSRDQPISIALNNLDFQPTLFVDPTIFAYRKSLNNLTIPDKKNDLKKNKPKSKSFVDPTIFAYGQTSKRFSTPERNLVAGYNNNIDITIKGPLTKVNTPPEQYYSTPLPMQMDDFYKFLRNQNIDVESVTAPLFDSVPKRIDTWHLYRKNVSKLSNKEGKIIQNLEHLKTFHKNLKGSGQTKKNHSLANLNTSKKEHSKPRFDNQKGVVKGNNHNRKNTQEIGETPEYENSNYLLLNQKYIRNLRKNSNLMPHLNLGSMDLFQLDDSPKQLLVNSQKEAKDMDVTVIDLETKNSNSDLYTGKFSTNLNKIKKYQQLRKQANLSNLLDNDISLTSLKDPYRDPLRFTHMYNENILSKKLINSPLYSNIRNQITILPTQPRRVQISGHSYKYDIIYQKPTYDWMSDIYELNPTLFTNNILKYKNYPTTIRRDKGSENWYNRGENIIYNNNDDLITFQSKIKKEIDTLDTLSPEYISTQTDVTEVLPLKKYEGAKIKSKKKFFFASTKVNNIDDEVYFEPLIQPKSNRRKSQGKISNSNNNKYYKRDVQGQDSFTARDVAALEVVVDLMKSTENFDEKGFHNAFLDIESQKNIPYMIPSLKPENHVTNAIQVHIALPSNINDKKRSLEPIKVRKIFSAVMSSPVDLEYQIHSFEDNNVTKVPQDVISPGLYLLVENTNITVPKGNFELKPIRSHIGISNFIMPKSSGTLSSYKSNMTDSINDHVSKITLNPDMIASVNNQLVKLYENMATLNETKSKRFIKKEEGEENKQKMKRHINMESVKKYFGHDRICNCHCKINETMCKPCAARDAVITELIFEFDNLASYMMDHCTEIQTFFWMNPTGGRKLKDTVHRIDTMLDDYNKRVKGKCQGKTCKMLSSSIDKRDHKIKTSISQFLNELESLADYLQKVIEYNEICDTNVVNAGRRCVNLICKCIDKNLYKRSYKSKTDDLNNKSIYSLNNIRVNLICNKDFTKHSNTRNTITEVLLERKTNRPLYYDDDEIKKDKKKGKNLKDLLKKYSNKIKFKKVELPQIDMKNNKKFTRKHNKRRSVFYNQIEAPVLADSGGTFWYKYLYDNMREPREQKYILKDSKIKTTITKKSKFSNRNLTKITEKKKTDNTTSSKYNLQEAANEKDNTLLNIDTLNHNLNDLFKLLGNIDPVEGNKTKLTTLLLKQSSTKIHISIDTKNKLTTTKKIRTTYSRLNSYSTFKKDSLTSKGHQQAKKQKASRATKTVPTKTVTPKILHTLKTSINNSKIGFFNRIVSGSRKFLGNTENKETTLKETKSSNIQPAMEYIQKYRQKFGVNTKKYSLNEINNYGIVDNDNLTTVTEPTIIIIEDIGFSDKYTVSINSKKSSKSDSIEFHSPDTFKRNSFKLLKEKDYGESPEDEMNDIALNSLSNRVKFKNSTQKVTHREKCDYYDYDIIHSIRKSLGLTSSNLTTPRDRKGAINRLIDKFSIKIVPDDKSIEPNEKKNNQTTISSKVVEPKLEVIKNLNMSVKKNISDTSNLSSTKKTPAAVANTTFSKSDKEKIKLTTNKITNTQSKSGGRNNTTKHLKEADEDELHQICDISNTVTYVSKLQKSMLKNNFEHYVKNIPCHKYNKIPHHFIIRSCIRKSSKSYSKRHRKSKIFQDVNIKTVDKWDCIRDKRFLYKDDTRVEDDKGKHFKDLEKNCLSNYLVPLIVTNCVNVDKDNSNEEINFQRDIKEMYTFTDKYNMNKNNVNVNFTTPKKYNIHNIRFKKRNLLSFSNYLLRRGYKKNFDLNGNFIQLWHGENDYYENFVRGKDAIYKKSLKRSKKIDIDMSELNKGLLNLPPLDPFTDEIYVMVANSITFDCYTSGSPKNQHEYYIWTTNRRGILNFKNVMIEGSKVFIKKIQTNNCGNYICSVNNVIVRSIKITVIDLPNIDIVFTPVYQTDTCTYKDLKCLQKLSEPMSHFVCKYNCSVRIDEPICLKNSVDGSALIRPIVVMSIKRQTNFNCSAECLRDLQCSLALLSAKNAPALALVKVLISYNGTKRILTPLRERMNSFVTHTLRRKDTNGHREYHRLAANMDPDSVNVVLLCSAGFYLVVGQKICAVCPPNTFSLEGENVCRQCPRGARSEPGARSCRLFLNMQKYNCPWKYVCGGAVCMLSCLIASCYAVSRLLRQQVSTEKIKTCKKTRKVPRMESNQNKSKSHPLSPSRVILSRLLRGSLSSSRATDSQETRFEQWKEKNTLPPLPPIDFEF